MRIVALSKEDNGLDSRVTAHPRMAPYLIVVDVDDSGNIVSVRAVPNPYAGDEREHEHVHGHEHLGRGGGEGAEHHEHGAGYGRGGGYGRGLGLGRGGRGWSRGAAPGSSASSAP
ncbi:NifB/NifX family molybdenum-iron cluster-binding protein [Conexivisphaera calida]|uniref:NifB/NifX family molybdenum-iron cluster-binding protein n=1 Tax=Conexivisphaera calida TaxID=1874277 RepID=UPI00157B8E3E|nr:NifB/NifX family molybdenum-iron cluster-binding protein [Conexivisphaera calida]